MAIIPRSSASLLQHPQDPLVNSSAPTPIPGPSSNLSGETKWAGLHPTDLFDNAHFRDRLVILHDLVFELRREVVDLQFRLQATEENVASFLQILSSMHAEISLDPDDSTPMEAPAAATGEGMDRVQRPTEVGREKDE